MEEETAYRSEEARLAAEFVEAWLSRSDWGLEEWVADFSGQTITALPPDEPYRHILEGLHLGGEGEGQRDRLAARLAEILNAQPDTEALDATRSSALHNVLMTCAGVRRPEILAQPLRAMLDRGRLPDSDSGRYLRFALRQALMMNPPGRELESLWVEMAEGKEHPLLPSSREAGFEGVLLLPPDEHGRFPAEAMSAALKAIADGLETEEPREDRRDRRFAGLLNRVLISWPVLDMAELFRLSFTSSWSGWACRQIDLIMTPGRLVAALGQMRADAKGTEDERVVGGIYDSAAGLVKSSSPEADYRTQAIANAHRGLWQRRHESSGGGRDRERDAESNQVVADRGN